LFGYKLDPSLITAEGNVMTDELNALISDLDLMFFRYACITGAIDLFEIVLGYPYLQRALSKDKKSGKMMIASGLKKGKSSLKTGKRAEIIDIEIPRGFLFLELNWQKQEIHRSMMLDDEEKIWYPELPIKKILAKMEDIWDFVYGIIVSRFVSVLEVYFSSVLLNYFSVPAMSGSSWGAFITKTKIDLLECKHGQSIYTLIQERHKIEHCKARIDNRFIERMYKKSTQHAYKEGDVIQKNHLDILAAHQTIREFAADVDAKLSGLIRQRNRA